MNDMNQPKGDERLNIPKEWIFVFDFQQERILPFPTDAKVLDPGQPYLDIRIVTKIMLHVLHLLFRHIRSRRIDTRNRYSLLPPRSRLSHRLHE